MPGNGKVLVSYTPEDAALCSPLFAALDAWEVDYRAEPAELDATHQLPPAVQREISERDIFVRICTPAAQRSIPLNLQVGVYRGLQANDRQGNRGNRRALINLILAPGYAREPFDNALLFIDATTQTRQEWLGELGRALGVRLMRARMSRRAVLGLGAAAVTTAAALTATGALLLDYHARTQTPKFAPGELAWKKDAGKKAPPDPTITDDAIYALSDEGLYAFHINDGRMLYHASVVPRRGWDAPVLNNGFLYLLLDDTIYALNPQDGSKRWSASNGLGTDYAGGPTFYHDELYAISSAGDVVALSASTGKQRWTVTSTAASDLDNNVSVPVADGAAVYFGSRDHYLYALNKRDGSIKWKFLARGPIYSTPAVANDAVYFASLDNYVYALHAHDGSLLWRFKTDNGIVSSPFIAGSVLFIGSRDQYLYALDCATGALYWRAPAGDIDNYGTLTGNKIDGSPVAEGGVVAVVAMDTVYAFNVRDGSRRWRLKPGADISNGIIGVALHNGVVCFGFSQDHSLYTLGA